MISTFPQVVYHGLVDMMDELKNVMIEHGEHNWEADRARREAMKPMKNFGNPEQARAFGLDPMQDKDLLSKLWARCRTNIPNFDTFDDVGGESGA